MFYWIEFNK